LNLQKASKYMPKKEPLVSINLPTMNRKDDLRNTLLRLQEQSYKNFEVIIVDNNSIDNTIKMLRDEFPKIKLIRIHYNIGSIIARSIAAVNSQGKYIFSIDDDSFPGRNSIGRMVEEFEKDGKLGLVAFGVLNSQTHWLKNDGQSLHEEIKPIIKGRPHEVVDWSGCGAGIRRQLFEKIDYWHDWDVMWERSLSVRILAAGYKIKSFPDIYVYHGKSETGESAKYRLSKELYVTQCRSHILFYLRYYPWKRFVKDLWRLVFASCYASLELKTHIFLYALFSALKFIPEAVEMRQVLSPKILSQIRTPLNFKGK